MRIMFLTGRELSYPRNDVLLRAFNRLGTVDVIDGDQIQSPLIGTTRLFFPALLRLLRQNLYDLIFVGFFGHMLMFPIGILSRVPVLFDPFISVYDTLCFDRKIFRARSAPGRLSFFLDYAACHLATHILLDTQLHADYFAATFKISPGKLSILPVGCNEDIFIPRQESPSLYTRVIYYSSYQPLHGVDVVVQAAAMLSNDSRLRFRLIGTGQEYKRVAQLAQSLHLKNVSFIPQVPLRHLPGEIADADICLGGHFGAGDKAGRVIPGKIYQILAMGRPLIAADTASNMQLLTHGENAYLCQRDNPRALADAILDLEYNPTLRETIAHNGRVLFLKRCSERIITEKLSAIIGLTRATR
jgi:glycosyltransferase involved in cell wall biosynthesis